MNLKKSTTLFTILSIVLASLLVLLGVFTYYDYQKGQDIIGHLEKEKTSIKNEISELIVKYDSVQFENVQMKLILKETKSKLELLRKELEIDNNPEVRSLLRYRKQVELLKAEKFRLLHLNDSLLTINDEIKDSLSKKNIALNQANDLTTILKEENIRLATIVNENKKLIEKFNNDYPVAISRIESEALRVRSSGKKFLTNKAKKTEQVRVCFAIKSENKSVEKLVMYLKVKNPKGLTIGDMAQAPEEKVKNFSDTKTIDFTENKGNACFIVEVNKKEMIPGIYKTELYYNNKMLGFSEFELF